MRLAELYLRRKYLKQKIEELQYYLQKAVRDEKTSQKDLSKIRNELNGYIDENQAYAMKITRANEQLDVSISETAASMVNALMIRETLLAKIDSIDNIIDNGNSNLDIMSFFEQRDQLYEEYFILNTTIEMTNWSADLD